MIVAAWITSVLLAIAYLLFGTLKLVKPDSSRPRPFEVVLGIAEICGALGMVLPNLTGIATFLTPVAAFALTLLQLLAIGVHLKRHETQSLPVNVTLLALSLFAGLAWAWWVG